MLATVCWSDPGGASDSDEQVSRIVVRPVEIERAVRAGGLAGRPVCLHSSLRSFGSVSGGPEAVIDAFLAAGATLLVPTASACFAAPRPAGLRARPFNCEDDGSIPAAGAEPGSAGFSVLSTRIDPEMGAVPAALLGRPDSRRGDHPLSSFSALGHAAAELVAGQTAEDVFAPLRALASAGGAVVLAGVDLTSATILHLAEEQAGLRLLVRWAYGSDNTVVAARHGGCSRGFERLAPHVSPWQTRVTVGRSRWRIFDAGQLLASAIAAFLTVPGVGSCDNAGCCRCRDQARYARAGPGALP